MALKSWAPGRARATVDAFPGCPQVIDTLGVNDLNSVRRKTQRELEHTLRNALVVTSKSLQTCGELYRHLAQSPFVGAVVRERAEGRAWERRLDVMLMWCAGTARLSSTGENVVSWPPGLAGPPWGCNDDFALVEYSAGCSCLGCLRAVETSHEILFRHADRDSAKYRFLSRSGPLPRSTAQALPLAPGVPPCCREKEGCNFPDTEGGHDSPDVDVGYLLHLREHLRGEASGVCDSIRRDLVRLVRDVLMQQLDYEAGEAARWGARVPCVYAVK